MDNKEHITAETDDSTALSTKSKDENKTFVRHMVVRDTLPDHFSGFVNFAIEGEKLDSQFSIVEKLVTIIPVSDNSREEFRKLCYNTGEDANHHRWFYGFSDLNSAVAFLQTTPVQERLSSGISLRAGYFHTPVIVHGADSSITDVHTFDAIEFYGGIMDILYNPRYAIDYAEDRDSIVFKNSKQNLYSFNATIDGENIRIILFIRASHVKSDEVPDLKNNICSSLRFEFDDNKTLDDIGKYYNYALRLFQFCTGHLNVRSNICLFNSKMYRSPIYVRMQDEYEDYANEHLKLKRVIGFLALGEGLPKLLSLLNDKKRKPYIEFLPLANRFIGAINYTQITDLCVSFENEYKCLDIKKDPLMIQEAEKLTSDLIECINKSSVSEVVKNKAKGIINGNLKNFSPSLKEKIAYIYERFKAEMRHITEQHEHDKLGITTFYTEKVFMKKIKEFTQIRGSAAHAGIQWNGGEDIFLHLVLLIYYSVLSRVGYSDDDCTRILSWLFIYKF